MRGVNLMNDANGYLSFVLHAHLPFVRHPEYEEFLEEDWLFEAITESYVPMLDALERLAKDGIRVRITLTISPSLAEMLVDSLLHTRYIRRLHRLQELAEKEVMRTRHWPADAFHESALLYQYRIQRALDRIEQIGNGNLLQLFDRFQRAGMIEIITSGATHGFLPLMKTDESLRAQLRVARENYAKHFGRAPRGVWLPECGYDWRVDERLHDAEIDYFFLDSHGLLHSTPHPKYGVYAPVYTSCERIAFARDAQCARQVWSRETGYPGDPEYREFYRDLGFDAPYDYIAPYLHGDGIRRDTGFKYHRITGKRVDLGDKQPYRPAMAAKRAREHAAHFVESRIRQAGQLRSFYDRPPLITAAYDAELFGHWWFEGPLFFEEVFRELHRRNHEVLSVTAMEYLERHPRLQSLQPASSSWGRNGFNEVWLNEKTDWIYRHLHECELRMRTLVQRHGDSEGVTRRALNQALRELMLAQSSDWAFQMSMDGAAGYAKRRTHEHISRFHSLFSQVEDKRVDANQLADYEVKGQIFSEIDYHVYQVQHLQENPLILSQ